MEEEYCECCDKQDICKKCKDAGGCGDFEEKIDYIEEEDLID